MTVVAVQALLSIFISFILCCTVWVVEPDVTHQTSWLGSTGFQTFLCAVVAHIAQALKFGLLCKKCDVNQASCGYFCCP